MTDDYKTDLFKKVKTGLKEDRRYPEPSIVCVGIGGGGCNIVSELNRRRNAVRLFCLNTDTLSNAKRSEVTPFNVGVKYIMNNRDSGGYVEVAKKAFKDDADYIGIKVIKRADLVLLVIALGGGTGSGGAIEMVRLLKQENVPFRVYAVRPFEFEDNRKEIADRTLKLLWRETNQIEIYDNNEFNSIGEINKSIKEDIDSYVESKLNFFDKMYTNWFDGLLNDTLNDVLAEPPDPLPEKTIYIDLEVDPVETELLRTH